MKKRLYEFLIILCCILSLMGGLIFANKKEVTNREKAVNLSEASKPQDQQLSYQPKIFSNMEELLTWIRTEDTDVFEGGRFRDGIPALREYGKLLMPSYGGGNIMLRFIEVLPDDFSIDGITTISHNYYDEGAGTERIAIYTKTIYPSYRQQAKNGLSDYLIAKNYKNYIEQPDCIQLSDGKEVPYAILDGEHVMQALFLYEGFEVIVTQKKEHWSDMNLNDMHLDLVRIEK